MKPCHSQLTTEMARLSQRGRQFSVSWQLSQTSQTVPAYEVICNKCAPTTGTGWFCIVFCFVSIASLNFASFWVTSTSQRLRKLTGFWDHFISRHLCSLCSSFFWYVYVHICISQWGDLNLMLLNHHRLPFSHAWSPIILNKYMENRKMLIRESILCSLIYSFQTYCFLPWSFNHLYMCI